MPTPRSISTRPAASPHLSVTLKTLNQSSGIEASLLDSEQADMLGGASAPRCGSRSAAERSRAASRLFNLVGSGPRRHRSIMAGSNSTLSWKSIRCGNLSMALSSCRF